MYIGFSDASMLSLNRWVTAIFAVHYFSLIKPITNVGKFIDANVLRLLLEFQHGNKQKSLLVFELDASIFAFHCI